MSHKEQRKPKFTLYLSQIQHLGLHRNIRESRDRLISNHEIWFQNQSPGNADALALTPRRTGVPGDCHWIRPVQAYAFLPFHALVYMNLRELKLCRPSEMKQLSRTLVPGSKDEYGS